MKRTKHLFEDVCSLENLHLAYLKARRGKQGRPEVAAFTFHLEPELLRLRDELRSGIYVPGPYRQFVVYEAKRRLISAAPFRDRVVHHAVCNVIEPIFEPTFIHDSYACLRLSTLSPSPIPPYAGAFFLFQNQNQLQEESLPPW